MKANSCALTDVGLLRTNNEDSVFADEKNGLFILADGMGGHAAGEVASAMAVDGIRSQLPPLAPPPQEAADCLQQAFFDTSRDIRRAALADPARRGMGTTLSVLYLDGETAQLAHVGDSRIYRLRQRKLEQLSIDHTLVAEQLRRGLISAEQARNSQMRNILLQAVGLEDQVEVFLDSQPLQKDDLYLLCSDGLSDMLVDEQISSLLNRNLSPEQSASELIEAAKTSGGRDNISVIVIKICDAL